MGVSPRCAQRSYFELNAWNAFRTECVEGSSYEMRERLFTRDASQHDSKLPLINRLSERVIRLDGVMNREFEQALNLLK